MKYDTEARDYICLKNASFVQVQGTAEGKGPSVDR